MHQNTEVKTIGRQTTIIPNAPMARMLMDAGAKRVSADAAKALARIAAELGLEIGRKATAIAKHTGRKTVNAADIKLAAQK